MSRPLPSDLIGPLCELTEWLRREPAASINLLLYTALLERADTLDVEPGNAEGLRAAARGLSLDLRHLAEDLIKEYNTNSGAVS